LAKIYSNIVNLGGNLPQVKDLWRLFGKVHSCRILAIKRDLGVFSKGTEKGGFAGVFWYESSYQKEEWSPIGCILASLRKDLKMGVFSAVAVDSSIENILRFGNFFKKGPIMHLYWHMRS